MCVVLSPLLSLGIFLAAADVDDLHQGRLFDCDVQVNTANKLIKVLLNDKCASVPHGTSSTCLIFAAVMISFEKFCKYKGVNAAAQTVCNRLA